VTISRSQGRRGEVLPAPKPIPRKNMTAATGGPGQIGNQRALASSNRAIRQIPKYCRKTIAADELP